MGNFIDGFFKPRTLAALGAAYFTGNPALGTTIYQAGGGDLSKDFGLSKDAGKVGNMALTGYNLYSGVTGDTFDGLNDIFGNLSVGDSTTPTSTSTVAAPELPASSVDINLPSAQPATSSMGVGPNASSVSTGAPISTPAPSTTGLYERFFPQGGGTISAGSAAPTVAPTTTPAAPKAPEKLTIGQEVKNALLSQAGIQGLLTAGTAFGGAMMQQSAAEEEYKRGREDKMSDREYQRDEWNRQMALQLRLKALEHQYANKGGGGGGGGGNSRLQMLMQMAAADKSAGQNQQNALANFVNGITGALK